MNETMMYLGWCAFGFLGGCLFMLVVICVFAWMYSKGRENNMKELTAVMNEEADKKVDVRKAAGVRSQETVQ